MATVTSNAAEVAGSVVETVGRLGYEGPGRFRSTMAEDVRDAVAQLILERTAIEQKAPDGRPLAPLKESTLRRKRRLGYPETILVESGEMLALDQLKGEAVVTRESVGMTYGTTESAIKKAEWAHEGRRRKPRREKRPFYELAERDEPVLDDVHEKGLDAQLDAEGV